MDISFISSLAVSEATRRSISRSQEALVQAQQSLASGRKADIGLALGANTGRLVSLRSDIDQLDTLIGGNKISSGRLEATQSTLETVASIGQDFFNTLLAVDHSNTGPGVAVQSARAGLAAFTSTLNTTFNGEYVLAGINTANQPVNDYFAAGSANKAAVDTAFFAHFGFAQNDPLVATLTDTDIGAFIDGAYDTLFDAANWSANWSTASSTNITAKISASQSVEVSSNANLDPIRQIAKAFTMVADLGGDALSEGAFDEVVSRARDMVGNALAVLNTERGRIGIAQQNIADASDRMEIQVKLLTTTVADIEGVDTFEVSTKINTLLTQIEVSYALTSRVQRLSILNHL